MIERLANQRAYIDANVFIYAIERNEHFGSAAQRVLQTVLLGPGSAFTSELTLAEVLVQPFRSKNQTLIALYEDLLTDATKLTLVPVTRPILRTAAELRAASNQKLPDSIHLATALSSGCSIMVTQDQRMSLAGQPTSIELLDLSAILAV